MLFFMLPTQVAPSFVVALSEPSMVQVIGFLSVLTGVLGAAYLAYRGQVIGTQAKRIAERVEKQVTPNGGTTGTTGDATVRLEQGQRALEQALNTITTMLEQAVTRDDGRFARSERDLAALRTDVHDLGVSISHLAGNHEAVAKWIAEHTAWAHEAVARADAAIARLDALEKKQSEGES